MNQFRWQIPLSVMMLVAAALAWAMKPTKPLADQHQINLERMIPAQIGDWRLESVQGVVEVPPDLAAQLSRIYSETLSRVYVDSRGRRVMLSIAYGKDQRDDFRLHRPDICYPAQGFTIDPPVNKQLQLGGEAMQVRTLAAKLGPRHEAVTYWVTMGERVVGSTAEQKLVQIGYGLRQIIPDGMVFRVSTLDSDQAAGLALNKLFVQTLYRTLPTQTRVLFFGNGA
ncbi:EpsI family protein [Chitiniphilus purpureus]|uniref:EpsI family protein n=1 Tax=Chitiniphilus purpureus TaxID=2981137 RepID=A0ABY6DJU7_9NEIS|nr:exosortase-associated protein EpsI, B-type [Chitiniphilus sp. CD1]UXY14632.1 EpsI family protein [Chitiniphilus sp. CD1]